MSFYTAFIVGCGSFCGAMLRVLMIGAVSRILPHTLPHALPFGTICVNILGSFLIGFILGLPFALNSHFRSFLAAGVLGGFTTFSTFTFENLMLIEGGSYTLASINILSSVFLALLFCYFGAFVAKMLF